MKKLLIAYFLILNFLLVSAQNKILTMEDAMLKARTTLAPQNLSQLQFFGNTDEYIYLKKLNGAETWFKGNFITPGDSIFLTLDQLNSVLKQAGLDVVKTMPVIKFSTDSWKMTVNGSKISLNPVFHKYITILPAEISSKEIAEESSAGFIAYLENNNLFVSDGKKAKQVTTDGSKDIVYASSVHRDEFGIHKGIFWSNNGTKLAYYRMDQSMVSDYPIINWTERPAKAELIKYPMAGDKSHQVIVRVYNTNNQSSVWLKTGGPVEQYLTNIAWSPDDKFIFIAEVNREQNHMWLNQFDAVTGNFIKKLFDERDDKYVEPLVPMLFLKNNPNQFIWQSNRDGWNHLYLYDINGKLIKQLTSGNWEVLEVKGFDTKGENLFYSSTEGSPINRNLYSLNIKTGKTKLITNGSFVHNTQISDDGNFILDTYSSPENPRTIELTNTKTGKSKLLLQSPDPLADYAKGKLSLFSIKNIDGEDLNCRMFKPVNFDSTKKYPLIVYWYGGPHAQLILNSWNGGAGDYWFQYMAERGYIIFTLDTRGSDNRGKAFEQSIFRKLGDVQMEDMMSAMNYLSAQPFVDLEHMGLFGWSFGGFMTTDFLLNHSQVFKAGVAGGPVMNWQYYEIMYGERYMDTPQENPEGYEATNLLKQASKLKGKLLLIHGLQDPVVVQQHSVNFVKACVDAGVQVDYMIYPGHEHNVQGKDRVHLYQKVTDYLTEHLK